MLAHAQATRQKEYDHGVCQGCWQPLPERGREREIWAEVPAMELITCKTTQEEIMELYHQVYQLKRNPGAVPCSEETMEEICIEILETLKEHLWHRWGPTQPEEGSRWRSTGTITSRMLAQAEFHDHMQVTYDYFGHFWDRQQESCKEALRVARDAHHWACVAATLLEGHIEWLGHSITHGWSHSQGHQAVAGAQDIDSIGGVAGGRPPHWQTTQGTL